MLHHTILCEQPLRYSRNLCDVISFTNNARNLATLIRRNQAPNVERAELLHRLKNFVVFGYRKVDFYVTRFLKGVMSQGILFNGFFVGGMFETTMDR